MLIFWLVALLCASVSFRSKVLQALDEVRRTGWCTSGSCDRRVTESVLWFNVVSVWVVLWSWCWRTLMTSSPSCPLCVSIQPDTVDVFRFTTFYMYWVLLLVELILACFSDQPPLFSQSVKDPVSEATPTSALHQSAAVPAFELYCVDNISVCGSAEKRGHSPYVMSC